MIRYAGLVLLALVGLALLGPAVLVLIVNRAQGVPGPTGPAGREVRFPCPTLILPVGRPGVFCATR